MLTFKKLLPLGVTGVLALSGVTAAGAAVTATPTAHHDAVVHSLRAKAVKYHRVVFAGSYKGTIAMLWSSSSVKATSVHGTGVGTLLGHGILNGTGTAATASTCDPLSGTGYLLGSGSKLLIRVATSSKTQACAASDSAPTTVTVSGVATVINGTGKYVGAHGTLSFKGSFQIQSNKAGSSEKDSFSATLHGALLVR
ncbi:MAG: hypothetical protein ACP5PB_01830 [Acidimicrobiales bacterium]